MKILVCLKVIKGEINPFDEAALECALQLSKNVTVISMAPLSAVDVLKPLTRLGAEVLLLSDSIWAGSDTLATSYILSEAIKKLDYDLILCGRQSIDGDTAQVGPMLSQMLSANLVTGAMSVTEGESSVTCITRDGEERVSFPALVTVERSYVLRFPSIFSKVRDIQILTNNDVGCERERCGLHGSPTRVLETFENIRGKRKCKFIKRSELDALIDELMKRDTIKEETTASLTKLSNVWAIGGEVYEKALEIAENVTLIEKLPADELILKISEEKPDTVLWNADSWGRRVAPVVAAALKTGLCADCTHLETDGEALFMYRPAQGGNISAKIRCLTRPQMATVRTTVPSSDIIVGAGRGVADKLDSVKAFAEKLNAEFAASRGLVDTGKVSYEHQVGLTGKTVSPKIYIAIGISGAVHHTCAIENADYIIAVNPSRDARIFDYADFGIIEEW